MNKKIDDSIHQLLILLSEGRLDEARSQMLGELAAATTKAKRTYLACKHVEEVCLSFLAIALANDKKNLDSVLTQPPSLSAATVSSASASNTRSSVLTVAEEVARKNGGIAYVGAVVLELSQRGLALESKRPTTSIANILAKAETHWERVGPNVFRLIA